MKSIAGVTMIHLLKSVEPSVSVVAATEVMTVRQLSGIYRYVITALFGTNLRAKVLYTLPRMPKYPKKHVSHTQGGGGMSVTSKSIWSRFGYNSLFLMVLPAR